MSGRLSNLAARPSTLEFAGRLADEVQLVVFLRGSCFAEHVNARFEMRNLVFDI